MPGLEFSPGRLSEDRDIERLVGDELLQACVFALKLPETLCLVDFQAAELPTLAVVRLGRDTDLPAGLCYGFTLGNKNFCFSQMRDDLFRRMPSLGHQKPLSIWSSVTLDLDQI